MKHLKLKWKTHFKNKFSNPVKQTVKNLVVYKVPIIMNVITFKKT